MAFKLGTCCGERSFCCVAILIAVFAATLRAQTSGENGAYPFSGSGPSLSLCSQPADECLLNTAAFDQNDSNLNHTNGSSSHQQDDWLHSWMRNVDEARASQPHFVSPIVTTHVMLVQQYRYDMSWQQDPSGGIETSNYGASRGLEIIPTTRLEVGIFPPGYLVHQSKTPDGFGDLSWQVKFRAFSATEHKGDYFVGFFLGGSFPTGTPPNGQGHSVLSPTSQPRRALGRGTFRAQLALTFQPVGRISWATQLSSIPKLTTRSRAKSGLCSSKILRFGRAGRSTERRKFS
jgi:hypothetical protein